MVCTLFKMGLYSLICVVWAQYVEKEELLYKIPLKFVFLLSLLGCAMIRLSINSLEDWRDQSLPGMLLDK